MTSLRDAARSGRRHLEIRGGDGAVNRAVNELAAWPLGEFLLGVEPSGTGNDLARSVEIAFPRHSPQAPARVPVCRARSATGERLWLNAASGGDFSRLAAQLTPSHKRADGYLGVLQDLRHIKPRFTEIRTASQIWTGDAIAVIVASGSTIAGGFRVSPSTLADRSLHVSVFTRECLHADFALGFLVGATDPRIVSLAGDEVHVSGDPCPWNLDGECFGEHRRIEFSVSRITLRAYIQR